MSQRVVDLHTVLSAAAQFGELARELLPASVQVWHTVDEMLAKVAVGSGRAVALHQDRGCGPG